MRYRILIYLCLLSTSGLAQIKVQDLYGSWVATSVTYLSGDELPDENILKYTYVKYYFAAPEKLFISGIYYDWGREGMFSVVGNKINFKSVQGYVMNTVRLLELDSDKLVIVQGSERGLTDPWAIKYTFVREGLVQDAIPPSPSDIFSIQGIDTLYQSSQKIYAQFTGPAFSDYISENMSKKKISTKSGELLASFIVDRNGHADSLKILQGINPKYDKVYTEIFNSAKKRWIPAHLNGKLVSVVMQQRMRYFTSDEVVPSYFNGNKANEAYSNKDYEVALQYYNLALENRPDEKDYLYKRGICKQNLGNMAGACADWQKLKSLGGDEANALIEKFCK